nr:transposase, MuDR, MULE transposase domain protein [Tanacetum cinerariifolium]
MKGKTEAEAKDGSDTEDDEIIAEDFYKKKSGGGVVVVLLWCSCCGGGVVVLVLSCCCCGGGGAVVVFWKKQRTVTRIKTDEEGVFEMLCISIGASGTNLLAVGMDGNNQIVPIDFGICKGETGPCWSWWMSVLKECISDNPNMLFISDRHPDIALAVRIKFPLSFHDPNLYNKLIQAGPQRWSRAHCPLIHYNYMTSNSMESINACTVLKRRLPITMLTKTYRAMVQDWYFKCQELAAHMKYEVTDWVADKVHKRKLKSAAWIVHGIYQYQYQVSDGRYNREFNLMTGSCEYQKWQLSGIPCGTL